MEKGESIQSKITQLMKNNMDAVETHFLKWLNVLVEDVQINTFMEAAEGNIVWSNLADIANFKTIAFEAEFFNKKTIENYVAMLEDIWNTQRNF